MKISISFIATALLLTACVHIPKDHVSDYDFSSAHLEDLPWEMGAAIVGPRASFDYNDYVKEHYPDWNYVQFMLGKRLFEDLSHLSGNGTNSVYVVDNPAGIVPQYESVDAVQCRLKDGVLWYHLCISNDVVTTEPDRWFNPMLEIKVLGHDDYNHDGFMDVLVWRRLPGSAIPWEELVLSRRGDGDPFYVVEHRDRGCRGME